MEPIPPTGYYQINYRAIRLLEMARINGSFWKAPIAYWAMRRMAPGNPCWMPGTSTENGCSREEVSPGALAKTEKERAAFASLGFMEVSYSKMRHNINPAFLDNAGFYFLNPEQGTIGICAYSLTALGLPGAPPLENKALAFTAVLENGAFSCSNEKKVFDPIPGSIVTRMKSNDPVEIYQRFTSELKRYEKRRVALRSAEEHRQWTDQQALNSFTHNVRRKLYVPMSEDEIAKAKMLIGGGNTTTTTTFTASH